MSYGEGSTSDASVSVVIYPSSQTLGQACEARSRPNGRRDWENCRATSRSKLCIVCIDWSGWTVWI